MFIHENLSDMKKDKISEDFKKIFINKEAPKKVGSIDLLKANEEYNKLVNEGVIKKRGYTLRGIEDVHLFNVSLNGY